LILWGFFALSEIMMALEDELLETVYNHCLKLALSDPSDSCYTELSTLVKKSPLAMDVFKQHGWKNASFSEESYQTPSHLLRICQSINRARDENVKSALEIRHWTWVKCLARLMQNVMIARKLMTCRLRILPANELSGLGVNDLDGGRILRKAQRLIVSINRKAKSDTQATTTMLEREVRELNTLVHSQDVLLQALAKKNRRGFNSQGTSGQQTPQSVDEGSVSSVSSGMTSGTIVTNNEIRPRVHWTSMETVDEQRMDQASRSTVSDQSAGQLSERSAASSTPPPSAMQMLVPSANVVGRSQRRSAQNAANENTMSQVALQLLEVVQNQQRIMSQMQVPAMQGPGSHCSSRSTGGASRKGKSNASNASSNAFPQGGHADHSRHSNDPGPPPELRRACPATPPRLSPST
jgi:hypothetical protein